MTSKQNSNIASNIVSQAKQGGKAETKLPFVLRLQGQQVHDQIFSKIDKFDEVFLFVQDKSDELCYKFYRDENGTICHERIDDKKVIEKTLLEENTIKKSGKPTAVIHMDKNGKVQNEKPKQFSFVEMLALEKAGQEGPDLNCR